MAAAGGGVGKRADVVSVEPSQLNFTGPLSSFFFNSPAMIGTNAPTLVLKTTPLARDPSRSSGRPCLDLDTSVKVSTIQPLKAQNGPGVAAPVISPGLLAALFDKVKATRPTFSEMHAVIRHLARL